ncbi:MAG TPA: murein L,D-transpeptidase catalytic domain family protein [Candidatus Polarisedimenticolia bacterium]|nr:murein L,D-transpeptidase catalytic domain family protein [Candidatus Polarisedimenticolia bacterium]
MPPAESAEGGALAAALLEQAPTLRPEPLAAALRSLAWMERRGEVRAGVLTVIDYGLPSRSKRLWVFDLPARKLLFHEMVAHGKNSGHDLTVSFSNQQGSLMTSLGAFVTGATYTGRNGYSLRLRGMDPGLNHRAEARAIVMHGAPYVNDEVVKALGRLGRSHGCPALRLEIAPAIIDTIKEGSLLYSWHPSLETALASAPGPGPGAQADAADSTSSSSRPPDRF